MHNQLHIQTFHCSISWIIILPKKTNNHSLVHDSSSSWPCLKYNQKQNFIKANTAFANWNMYNIPKYVTVWTVDASVRIIHYVALVLGFIARHMVVIPYTMYANKTLDEWYTTSSNYYVIETSTISYCAKGFDNCKRWTRFSLFK